MPPQAKPDCPGWNYDTFPDYKTKLVPAVNGVLTELRDGRIDSRNGAADTRSAHAVFFRDLTPPQCPYYAGHYRGEAFLCLRDYEVAIPSDNRVGFDPGSVVLCMSELRNRIKRTIDVLDHACKTGILSKQDKLLAATAAACAIFEYLLRIHPYADGNGHAARFCLFAIMARYGFWLKRFQVEPRPEEPTYTVRIEKYRNGEREPLEQFVMECLRNNE